MVLELIEGLACEPLEPAFEQGVIHRDLHRQTSKVRDYGRVTELQPGQGARRRFAGDPFESPTMTAAIRDSVIMRSRIGVVPPIFKRIRA